MSDSIADSATGFLIIVVAIFVLFTTAGLVLLISMVISGLVWLFELAAAERAGQRGGMFGAPTSHWWLDLYEVFLWRVEDVLAIDLSESPARIIIGAMLITAVAGGSMALAAQYLIGAPFWLVFGCLALVNGLSAWFLSQSASEWWDGLDEGNSFYSHRGGFRLGNPWDE